MAINSRLHHQRFMMNRTLPLHPTPRFNAAEGLVHAPLRLDGLPLTTHDGFQDGTPQKGDHLPWRS